jgi:hypothetical protein
MKTGMVGLISEEDVKQMTKRKKRKRMVVRVEYLDDEGKVFDSWDVCEVNQMKSATDLRKMKKDGRIYFEVEL